MYRTCTVRADGEFYGVFWPSFGCAFPMRHASEHEYAQVTGRWWSRLRQLDSFLSFRTAVCVAFSLLRDSWKLRGFSAHSTYIDRREILKIYGLVGIICPQRRGQQHRYARCQHAPGLLRGSACQSEACRSIGLKRKIPMHIPIRIISQIFPVIDAAPGLNVWANTIKIS